MLKGKKKSPKKPLTRECKNISKWRLQSAESAPREDGDIYMDFWEHILPALTHVCSRQSCSSHALILRNLKKKKPLNFSSRSVLLIRAWNSSTGKICCFPREGGNKIQLEMVLGWFCSKIIHRKQTFCCSSREILEHLRRNRALPTCGSGQAEKQPAQDTFS